MLRKLGPEPSSRRRLRHPVYRWITSEIVWYDYWTYILIIIIIGGLIKAPHITFMTITLIIVGLIVWEWLPRNNKKWGK